VPPPMIRTSVSKEGCMLSVIGAVSEAPIVGVFIMSPCRSLATEFQARALQTLREKVLTRFMK